MDLKEYSKPDDILHSDPIRETTRRARRNLLFFSVIVLISISYGTDTISLPLTKLPATAMVGALGCVVLYQLVSFLISFTTDVQGWHAKQRILIGEQHLTALTHLSSRMNEVDTEFMRVSEILRSHIIAYKEQIEFLSDPFLKFIDAHKNAPSPQEAIDILKQAFAVLERHAKPPFGKHTELSKANDKAFNHDVTRLGDAICYLAEAAKKFRGKERTILRETTELRILQYLKVYIWEGLLPLLLAGFAASKATGNMFDFVKSLI